MVEAKTKQEDASQAMRLFWPFLSGGHISDDGGVVMMLVVWMVVMAKGAMRYIRTSLK